MDVIFVGGSFIFGSIVLLGICVFWPTGPTKKQLQEHAARVNANRVRRDQMLAATHTA